MNYRVLKYEKEFYNDWNNFIVNSKNGTFLFHRDFMEYHSDRFEDYSLMVYKKEKLMAVLPANIIDNSLYSHQGLTFGGVILQTTLATQDVFVVFEELCAFLKEKKIDELYINQIPDIYFKSPASEIGYLLANKAELVKREMVLAIDYAKPLTIHKTKLKHFRKASNINLEIKESSNFLPFWTEVLEPRLMQKHHVKPVHNLLEIEYLNKHFPKNIKQFDVYLGSKILAGITVFENEYIVKSQYGATTKEGEKQRALDYLFLSLIYKYKKEGKLFFSMGTVLENNIKGYNEGLLKQKEELGCKVYLQDFFKLKLND
ncbi:FemAB family protein [Pseudalgibacter alginicilyticus]|uniref:FemAB family protein n=1 Tax=Pseudalgibacter alginicilyticus TaxID=1736674 RepID=A0A0N7HYA0_9FLAO|nr:hypothetical protein [Pseudalgibacter alginicilyticus]ALJ04670.1 FemAB family protein [Pseudalgibacter alginicilyticus]